VSALASVFVVEKKSEWQILTFFEQLLTGGIGVGGTGVGGL
jgi:hypothetical protein